MTGALKDLTALAAFTVCTAALLLGCKEDRAPVYSPPAAEQIPNPDVPHDRLPEQTSAFVETACAQKAARLVTQCGTVTVPEGPGSDREIKIAVARVFTGADDPKPEPLVYLDGGPGAASVASLATLTPIIRAMAPDRDLIFVDHRGVGQTRPELGCYEDGELEVALPECHDRLSKKADLNHYSTLRSAEDMDRVRAAFGYEQWNVLGISYGTRLGLVLIRDFGEHVRSVILDSVVPPHVDLVPQIGISGKVAIDRAFAACAADPDCQEAYPGVQDEFLEVVARLDAEPEEIGSLELTGADVVKLVFNLLYSPDGVENLPYLVHDLHQGDFSFFEEILDGPAGAGGGFSFGMHVTLRCAEDLPFTTPERFTFFDAQVPELLRAPLSGAYYLGYCDLWPVEPTPASEGEPVVSDVPALVLSGYFDPITPPQFADAAAQYLTQAQNFMISSESHGASFGECGAQIAKEFVSNPTLPVTGACLSDLPPLEFSAEGAPVASPRPGSGAPRLRFRTERPSAEDVASLQEQLKLRLRLFF